MKSSLLAAGALAALAFANAAHAQDVPEEAGEEITVTGQRAQQERAIELKRDAISIVDVAAADEIGRLPDRNVAEVIERLPGVGVTYDQGEGRYVAIRGVPSDLNNYSVNGVEIGNPDGTSRSLPLDVVSGQLLNRVEVVKAKTADLDGQGIGGSINLVTQTAFDYRKAFNVTLNAQAGYQELNKKVPVRGDASIAARFGSEEQFGIALGASYSNRTFASYGVYPDDWRPATTPATAVIAQSARGALPVNIKFTDYSLQRERIGAAGSFDFRPNENHQFHVRGIYSKFTEEEYRQRYRLDFASDALLPRLTFNPGGLTGTVTGTPNAGVGAGVGPERRQDLRFEYKEKSILAGMLGGSSHFGDVTLDYVVARVHNEVREPNQLWQFRCNPGTVDFDLTEKVFSATPRTECTSSQLNFRQYTEQNESGDEDIWQGRADLTWHIAGLDEGSFVKLGGKYRATDKWFDSANDTWTRGGNAATRFTLAQFNLSGAPVTVYPDGDDRPYFNAPTIDLAAIRDFTASNLSGPFFVRDTTASLANATLNDFRIDEDVTAGYAMVNLRFGAVTVTPGIRFEHTKSRVTGYRLEGGTTVVPATVLNEYDDWLPSLIVRLEPSRNTVFRLGYTRNLGRPNYSQLSPGGSLSYEDANSDGQFEGSFSAGNAALKPYRADNLDFTGEWYFSKGGLLTVGVFAKFIKNPIFVQNYVLTNTSFAGRPFERLGFSQPLNADSGDIIGIEAAYQQQFTFLPGFLSGFGIELNGTLTDSNLQLPSGRTSTFPSQSGFLYGAQLFYQRGRVEASIAYHNTGHSLIAPGGVDYQDQYNDDLRRLDFKASFEVFTGATLFVEAQNLTDEPTRQYQGGRTDWISQNERYGRTVYGGVSVKF
ncbi:TonB-dependent receptor [Sphingomonas sp. G-3-2-10]|uniref:TonB-dependent receptor n=1 Tax=Sphingomonas sp. G-3-2-10 TaxID=2728838 RepID=UPI00146B7354|nr:TonB-dependent receptor [Sphingomonas sp. G-3-2-10]NML04740.1 TonB-dependent receptor [Sphingomonas sp. G-3-2-10]